MFFKKDAIFYNLIKSDINLRLIYYLENHEKIKKENIDLWNYYLGFNNLNLEETIVYQWPKEGFTESGGWLETQWHQNSPFNDFCPIDLISGRRSLAGCPAVAMAQILNYHQTTNNIIFNDSDDYYHSYAGNNFWIDDDFETYDFPSFTQLNSYLDELVFNYQNQKPLSDENKAALVFACGVAAKQVYHPDGSGTFGVNQAYKVYHRFYFDDCDLIKSDPDLYERVQGNIINGLPVHLAVVDQDWKTGHNLVIDGYKTDGYYHLNFGWQGYYDGWYKLPEDIPYGLNVIEGVIVDIVNKNSNSDLHAKGVLYWPDVKAGSTVKGSFTIENVGETGSEIDWEVLTWPSLGSWSFKPASGKSLTTEYGPLTINVSVNVPNKKNKNFNGYIKIVDINNNINSCLVHVSLTTKLNRDFIFSFNSFIKRNIIVFLMFKFLQS
jgi:hypothetical protein